MEAQHADMPRIEADESDTYTTTDALVTSTEDAIIIDMVHAALCQIQALGKWTPPPVQQPAP